MYSVANSLSLNPHTLQLQGALVRVDITDPECRLLMAFARAGQQRLETVHMLDCVGKAIGDPGKRALEVQIVRLRKKLEQAGASGPTIKSIRGVGYQLCVPLHIDTHLPQKISAVPLAPTFVAAKGSSLLTS